MGGTPLDIRYSIGDDCPKVKLQSLRFLAGFFLSAHMLLDGRDTQLAYGSPCFQMGFMGWHAQSLHILSLPTSKNIFRRQTPADLVIAQRVCFPFGPATSTLKFEPATIDSVRPKQYPYTYVPLLALQSICLWFLTRECRSGSTEGARGSEHQSCCFRRRFPRRGRESRTSAEVAFSSFGARSLAHGNR